MEKAGDSDTTECSNTDSSVDEGEAKTSGPTRSKNSFVWNYFRTITVQESDSKSCECLICNASFGHTTSSNLARHLAASHNIIQEKVPHHDGTNIRGRPSRSRIWKYCTKVDTKRARCHLCNKQLYFGGGNTANISKHLLRRHPEVLNQKPKNTEGEMSNSEMINEDVVLAEDNHNDNSAVDNDGNGRKERKGGSYVWNYCDKLSRHNIRCNLCNKTMSFHGTANIITHLQRRHNILGKIDGEKNDSTFDTSSIMGNPKEDTKSIEELDEEQLSGDELNAFGILKRRKRSAASTSIVWKYCKRISLDAVRCKFCKKNLSFQGTSNLQRHLHRMHGVVTHARDSERPADDEEGVKHFSGTDFIWEYCTLQDDDNIKCSMCAGVFSLKQMDTVVKHLTGVHAIRPRQSAGSQRSRERNDSIEDSSSNEYDEWNKLDSAEAVAFDGGTAPIEASCSKKEEALYNALIEEEDVANCEEGFFDSNLVHEMPLPNPLSPQSSQGDVCYSNKKLVINSKRLQELNEERVQMETEYFREKAGFYRMQKYLTALQAKKIRLELERFNASGNNDVNNDAYAISITAQNLPT